MKENQQQYLEYLQRLQIKSHAKLSEINKLKLVREVGKSYGLNDAEMDEVVLEGEKE